MTLRLKDSSNHELGTQMETSDQFYVSTALNHAMADVLISAFQNYLQLAFQIEVAWL